MRTTLWDEGDYGGDLRVLREEVYPPLKQAATFSAAFTQRGEDGRRHGITTFCMFRWNLERAAEVADLLGVDATLTREWRSVAPIELADEITLDSSAALRALGLRTAAL